MQTAVSTLAAPEARSTPHFSRPTFLMCSPQFFGVDYVLNPWMAGALHRSSRDTAFAQWRGLYDALHAVADIKLLHPEPHCPDMCFLSHGALVHHGVAALASFSHGQRRAETPFLSHWLAAHGFLLWDTPRETAFEGEGDITFSPDGATLWAAHGSRTCLAAHRHLADAWHLPVRSLHLVDPRFYHLDTCFTPLPGGHLLWFPSAFDAASRTTIESAFEAGKRIAVTAADAVRLACATLAVGQHLFTGEISDTLAADLATRGFNVHRLPLGEFLKSGAGARSLALRLSDLPITHTTTR